jgi:IS605 OrfB family transposase
MRKVLHGKAWFDPETLLKIKRLMLLQCSAMRCAYQFIQKGHHGNEVVKYIKEKYYSSELNARFIGSACSLAEMIPNSKAIFGGKKKWKDLQSGKITKEEWQFLRNSTLYSNGEKANKGNSNIRIVDNKILVNDSSGRGKWFEGKLYVPKKFKKIFDSTCYDVRLKLQADGSVEVIATWEVEPARIITSDPFYGTIGVDTNPDGCALVETNKDGNIVKHVYEQADRIKFASQGKRDYDVKALANKVVEKSIKTGKPLVIEKLNFKAKKSSHKFNRMRHNFLHRQILDAIKSKAANQGVEVIEVEPAFTSILGQLKYQKSLSLNRHTAAALVIARRGMSIVERTTFTVTWSGKKKDKLNLEGRGLSTALTRKAFSWFEDCFLKSKPAVLTGPLLVTGLKPVINSSASEILAGESVAITSRNGVETKVSTKSLKDDFEELQKLF